MIPRGPRRIDHIEGPEGRGDSIEESLEGREADRECLPSAGLGILRIPEAGEIDLEEIGEGEPDQAVAIHPHGPVARVFIAKQKDPFRGPGSQ